MKLLIDDDRKVSDFHGCEEQAFSYEEGIRVLRTGLVDTLWLDCDLGGGIKESGIHLLRIGYDEDLLPDHICLVTSSESARDCMSAMLDFYGYRQDGNWFHKGFGQWRNSGFYGRFSYQLSAKE